MSSDATEVGTASSEPASEDYRHEPVIDSTGRPPVLVVGSYPPTPGRAAAVTLAMVRRLYAGGDDVDVVSPRATAAHRMIRVTGRRAGERLEEARRAVGSGRLVMCLEAGLPIPVLAPARRAGGVTQHGARRAGSRWAARRSAARVEHAVSGLVPALRAFDHVTLVVTGDLEVPAAALGRLWGAATTVIAVSDSPPDVEAARLGVPGGRLETMPVPNFTPAPPGVSLMGPPEITPNERPRQLVALAARRVLGRHAPAVRGVVAGAVRRGRQLRR